MRPHPETTGGGNASRAVRSRIAAKHLRDSATAAMWSAAYPKSIDYMVKAFVSSRKNGDHRSHCPIVCTLALAQSRKRFQDSRRIGGSRDAGAPTIALVAHQACRQSLNHTARLSIKRREQGANLFVSDHSF